MPRLPQRVKRLIAKSRDAAMFAVDVYNKPATEFRSANYVVMMLSAWTALLHALFEQRKVRYYYRQDGSNKYVYVSGERQPWSLETCLEEYFTDRDNPVRRNIEFFIGLQGQIEQRFLPALDLEIHGECQSLLLNYEKRITAAFGMDYGLHTALAIPIQLLTGRAADHESILKETRSRDYQVVKDYVDTFRAALDASVRGHRDYCFRVFLVPKIGEELGDVPVEFVTIDPHRPDEMEKYQKLVGFIVEEKRVPVVNPGGLKPGDVARQVREALGVPFHPAVHHVRCWRYYGIRPDNNSDTPEKTDTRYCHYDAAHGDYVYTEAWVALLIAELADENRRREVIGE